MSRKTLLTISRIFTTSMFIALAFGIISFGVDNFDFLINLMAYKKATLPNLAYWFLRIVGTILIPAVFLLPSIGPFERIKTAKVSFILYGVLHILTVTWIFWYFNKNGMTGLFSNKFEEFQLSDKYSFLAAELIWGNPSWFANILNLLYGAFCIYVGFNLDDNKALVANLVTVLAVCKLILPVICNVCTGNGFLSADWIFTNYADLISFACIAVAFHFAAFGDESWVSLVWDQDMPSGY